MFPGEPRFLMPVDEPDWQSVCLYFTHTHTVHVYLHVWDLQKPSSAAMTLPCSLINNTSKADRQAGGSEGVWVCVFLPESSRFQSNTVCLSKQGGLVTYWSSRQNVGSNRIMSWWYVETCWWSSGIGLRVSLRVIIWQKNLCRLKYSVSSTWKRTGLNIFQRVRRFPSSFDALWAVFPWFSRFSPSSFI